MSTNLPNNRIKKVKLPNNSEYEIIPERLQKNGFEIAPPENVDADSTIALTSNLPTKVSDLTNDRFVRYDTNAQGLNTTQKSNARTNIGLGTAATKNTGTSSGNVPVLDSNGKLDTAVLPAIAISDTFVVDTEVAMLALTAQVGDVCVRSDLNKSFILKEDGASTLSHWQELLAPGAVISVNNKTGAVTLTASDVGALPSDYVPAIKSLNTTNITSQDTNSNEAIGGTGTINLHKIAKTGKYSDLLNPPDLSSLHTHTNKTALDSLAISSTGVTDGTNTYNASDKLDKVNPTGSGSLSLNMATAKQGMALGTNSVVIGNANLAAAPYSIAEGYMTEIESTMLGGHHAEGVNTRVFNSSTTIEETNINIGGSHVEGWNTSAAGKCSHAEGSGYRVDNLSLTASNAARTVYTYPSGTTNIPKVGDVLIYSSLNGSTTKYITATATVLSVNPASDMRTITVNRPLFSTSYATGTCYIARGIAAGENAHSEGYHTSASGDNSHAEGEGTIAKNKSQHVFGRYNMPDSSTNTPNNYGTYAEIVGNGGNNNGRSNARTLDWSGNEWLAGNITINKTTLANTASSAISINLPSSAGTLAITSQLPDMTNVAYKNINNNFTTNQKFGGSLEINSNGSSWSEGIRIHPASNRWSGIVLCEASNSGSTGTSAKTWSIHNNEGAFGIYKNGSNASATQYFRNESDWWSLGGGLTVYGTDIYINNSSVARSGTTETGRNLSITDKNNALVGQYCATIGPAWNALFLKCWDKDSSQKTIEFVRYNQSGYWHFDPIVENDNVGVTLGTASRPWAETYSDQFNFTKSNAWKATMQYNTNTNSIDFIFA